jgi:hypothetical protein
VTYVWITQGLLMPVAIFGWYELALRIRTGDVAIDLVRPLDVQLRFPTPGLAAAFLVSVVGAVVVSYGFRFLYNLAFWLLDYRGAGMLALVVCWLLCGLFAPIAYYPAWLQTIVHALVLRDHPAAGGRLAGQAHRARPARRPGPAGRLGRRPAAGRPGGVRPGRAPGGDPGWPKSLRLYLRLIGAHARHACSTACRSPSSGPASRSRRSWTSWSS